MEFKNQIRFLQLCKKFPKTNFEKAKGDRAANLKYCSKDGVNVVRVGFPLSAEEHRALRHKALEVYYSKVVWRDWQKEIIKMVEGPTNERRINWIYEPVGGVGKSLLASYLSWKYDAILSEGKKADVFNQVLTHSLTHTFLDVVICDVPRTAMDYFQYGVIEKLKDCCLYSGKYEGGKWEQPRDRSPHIICFANTPPERAKMSKDRWMVYTVDEEGNLFEEEDLGEDLDVPVVAGDHYVPREYM